MKKFISALGYTFVRFVGISFLFWVFCLVLFLISGLIFYHLLLFGDSYGKGEDLLSAISVISISMCFLATFCVYYKIKYKDIVAKKLRCLTALRTNMWLWRNFYFIVLAWCLFSGLFGDKDYKIKDNLVFCLFNLAVLVIFCIFGKFTQSTRVKTEKKAVLEKILEILGVVALSVVILYILYFIVRFSIWILL